MHTNSCLLRFSMTSLQTGHTMCCKLIPYPLYRARGCEGRGKVGVEVNRDIRMQVKVMTVLQTNSRTCLYN